MEEYNDILRKAREMQATTNTLNNERMSKDDRERAEMISQVNEYELIKRLSNGNYDVKDVIQSLKSIAPNNEVLAIKEFHDALKDAVDSKNVGVILELVQIRTIEQLKTYLEM